MRKVISMSLIYAQRKGKKHKENTKKRVGFKNESKQSLLFYY